MTWLPGYNGFQAVSSSDNKVPTRDIITIYDTVISSEAGDKVFEQGFFLFQEVSRFF